MPGNNMINIRSQDTVHDISTDHFSGRRPSELTVFISVFIHSLHKRILIHSETRRRRRSRRRRRRSRKMWYDLILQAVLMLVSVVMFLFMYDVPQKYLTKLRYRNRADLKAKGHFVTGAQLLSKARSASSRSAAASLARDATAEADKAIALDPRDAASHILKALALDLQGFKTSALDSLDVAFSPLAVKSLGPQEKGDALYKRAELKVALSRRGKVDSAIDDLTQAVKLSPSPNPKVHLLLGECYEAKKMKEEAAAAYGQALKISPAFTEAREALDRLGMA